MKNEKTVRSQSVQCGVSQEEYITVENKAGRLGLSISNYLRMIALHVDITSLSPTNIYNPELSSKNKTLQIQCRVSEDEYNIINEKAKLLNDLSIVKITDSKITITSSYLRTVALNANIKISFDAE